jgi:hypothetical protein
MMIPQSQVNERDSPLNSHFIGEISGRESDLRREGLAAYVFGRLDGLAAITARCRHLWMFVFFGLHGCAPQNESAAPYVSETTSETGVVDAGSCRLPEPMTQFVTRDGGQLVLDGAPFKFASVNVPNLHMHEDPAWKLPTPWEQADAMCSVRQMGGRVARTYVLSIGESGWATPRHITTPGIFNEELFVALDGAIAAAADHGVRLIIPFVDQWHWWGGIAEYAGVYGLSEEEFFTDERVIADFELTIEHVLTRVNTITGVPYAEDPAILGWETGNELYANTAWTTRIAKTIVSFDENHLVIDGSYGVNADSLDDPNIDVVSNHYYWPPLFWDDYAAAAASDLLIVGGSRPFIVGEYGFIAAGKVEELLLFIEASEATGSLIWSLRAHDEGGGFYGHTEIEDEKSYFASYRWPGFASGDDYEESAVLDLISESAHRLHDEGIALGLETPMLITPLDPTQISWRGVAGASSYTLYRSENSAGPFSEVVTGFDDAEVRNVSLVWDPLAVVGGADAYYQLRAQHGAVTSSLSKIIGPVAAPLSLSWTDPLDDLSQLESHTDVVIDTANTAYFLGDEARLTRASTGAQQFTYHRVEEILAIAMSTWWWPSEGLDEVLVEASVDGLAFSLVSLKQVNVGGDWIQVQYSGILPKGTHAIRITLQDSVSPVWSPQIGEVSFSLK